MVSPVRLHHYLATTKIDPASCRGFEDEAFQALVGLVHYSQGSAGQREAWYRAVWNAHLNPTGGLTAGPNNKSFFYTAVLNRKNSTFGTSLAVPKTGVLDAVASPWALDDPTFDRLNAEIKQSKGLAGGKEVTWKDVTDASSKWQEQHGLSTPVAAFGWIVITGLVKKYAPEAVAALLGPEVTAGAAAGGFLAVAFYDWTVRTGNAQAKENFATDEARRLFDQSNPLIASELGQTSG